MSFVERAIDVVFELGTGSFQESPGKNAITLTGLRVSAQIANSGTIGADAQVRIWGMTDSQMAQLSTMGLLLPYIFSQPNFITVLAGDKGSTARTTVFKGSIFAAWQIFEEMPDVFFNVSSNTTYLDQLKPVKPISYSGSADVATIMQQLAATMGRPFKNWGVTASLPSPYFAGTAYQQAAKVAQAAGINMNFDPATGTLEIWPRDGTRDPDSQAPVISPDSGMIGYPSYTVNGIAVNSIFNPAVRFGSTIVVKSDLRRASGTYVVRQLTYNLESELPGGRWDMSISCYAPGVVVLPQPGPF